jgi:DNA repair protein RecO (recombination protein O)
VKQIITKGIVLGRTDYGEADRIITILTPDQGKLRLMARGVRRVKSKLAGGIELFSISDITYMPGKGDIGTLISSRLDKHYGNIVKDINRVQVGYDLIKQLNKATEDEPEEEYFHLLNESFTALNNETIDLELIKIWFQAQLLKLSGHTPNLQTDTEGRKLEANRKYNFDFDNMSFTGHPSGRFTADHIKVLRLLFSDHPPEALAQVQGIDKLFNNCRPILQSLTQQAA